MAEDSIRLEKPRIRGKILTNPRVKKGVSPTSAVKEEISINRFSPANTPTQTLPIPEGNSMQHDPSFENDGNPHQAEERTVYANHAMVRVTQQGRVIRLRDVDNDDKANFLIDVTDRVEPNQDVASGKTVRELYPDFDDPEFNNLTGSNNSIIVTVTDKFSPDRTKRIYISHLGELIWDANGKGSFPDYAILEKCGFTNKGHGVFVPFSFNSFRADEFFAREIGDAFTEQQDEDGLPALEDPNVIEANFSIKK